jgi:hypothetical protein
MRGGGEQRPDLQVSELKKTGARSARARTRGQNPLVKKSNFNCCCENVDEYKNKQEQRFLCNFLFFLTFEG